MSETFERNAKGVREMLSMKFDTLDFEGVWHDAFGTPSVGVSGLCGGTPVTERLHL